LPVDFRRGWRKRPLAAGEIKHRVPPVELPAQRFGQGIPGRGGTGKFSIAEGQTKQLGDFERI
jgi:hypothetical protein